MEIEEQKKAVCQKLYSIALVAIVLSLTWSIQARANSKANDPFLKACEGELKKIIAKSLVKSRGHHIARMKGNCKQILLANEAFQQRLKAYGQSLNNNPLYSLKNLKSKYASWGIDPNFRKSSINLTQAWKIFKKKERVIVAVIDTGIDPSHRYVRNNIYVQGARRSDSNYGKDFSLGGIKASNAPIDTHGHGTHVSGIIRSVFPEVSILPIKYYNPNKSGEENLQFLINSLQYAIRAGADIINYSGGGPRPSVQELKVLKESERKGVLLIAAAGNDRSNIDNKNTAFYPASYGLNNIVTVTAHDQSVQILNSSNWGEKSVDLAAPGNQIRSSVPFNRSAHMTGTSQATAFVSGVAAMIKSQYPNLSAQDIKIVLRRSSKKIKSLNKKCLTSGKLDATKALAIAKEYSKRSPSSTQNFQAQ